MSKRDELLNCYGAMLHEDHKVDFSKSHADFIAMILPDLLNALSQSDFIAARLIPDTLLRPAALTACLVHGILTRPANSEDGVFRCWKSVHSLLLRRSQQPAAAEALTPTLEHGLRLQFGQAFDRLRQSAAVGHVAASANLLDLLLSKYQKNNRPTRLELLQLLLQFGADRQLTLTDPSLCFQFSRDLLYLLDEGLIGIDCLGEYPLHAALTVALEHEPGYFDLFDHLVERHRDDPDGNAALDPQRQDSLGNTLFHHVVCHRSRYALDAVRHVADTTLANPNLRNRSRRTALQCIHSGFRRREHSQIADCLTRIAVSHPDPQPLAERRGSDPTAESDASDDGDDRGKAHDGEEEDNGEEADGAEAVGRTGPSAFGDSSARGQWAAKVAPGSQLDQLLQAISARVGRLTRDHVTDMQHTSVKPPNPREIRAEEEDDDEDDGADESMVDDDYDEGGVLADDSDEELPEMCEDLDWEIECTEEVLRSLKRRRCSRRLKRRIVTHLRQLASGKSWGALAVSVKTPDPDLCLYTTRVSRSAQLLWERAIAFNPKRSRRPEGDVSTAGHIYCDVLRLWAIVGSDVDREAEVERVVTAYARGATCALARNLVSLELEGAADSVDCVVPGTYSLADESANSAKLVRFRPPGAAKETEYHIVKFYSWDVNLVNAILSGETNVDFPFRVTEKEYDIIGLRSAAPVLLIGRSGTGKTTCCVYRMFAAFSEYWRQARSVDDPLLPRRRIYRLLDADADNDAASGSGDSSEAVENYDEADDEDVKYDHLRQLFVTKNPVLCREVRKNFFDLCNGLKDMPDLDFSDELPTRLQDTGHQHYPMFLNIKQLIMLLDASLPGQPFFQRSEEDGSLTMRVTGWDNDDAGIEWVLDSNCDDLYGVDDGEEGGGGYGGAAADNSDFDSRREVSYEVFEASLWKEMTRRKRVTGLHPSLVWTEIMSFIKGSVEALCSEAGFLSREQYCELGRSRAPEFSDSRERIYELFLEYQRVARDTKHFDICDVVSNLYRRLVASNAERPDWTMHNIYVDETQDFTQAELCLLLLCCQNPNDMFFTGDTAQSIMRGVSFRFEDLKTLFYTTKQRMQSCGNAGALTVPKSLLMLTHNYRSHAGILSLASSVIFLLTELFPSTFDKLEPDLGLFRGPRPVLIESCSAADLAFLLQGTRRSTNAHIDFGAHQAIIVANEESRRYLLEHVPELSIALVLTVFESKGLEFDDVLLYNFFKDSPASAKDWRVISGVLKDLVKSYRASQADANPLLKELDLDVYSDRASRPIDFNPGEHKILNSILKHLYTAITRARVNVWIFDDDEEARRPVFEFFKTLNVVKVVESGSDSLELSLEYADGFAATSSDEQWRSKGHEFYCRRLYDLAAKCYGKCRDSDLQQLAQANARALSASKLTDAKQQREEFVTAAQEYLRLGWVELSAKCLHRGKQPLLAAKLFELLGQYRRVFIVYNKSQLYVRAAEALQMSGQSVRAVKYLFEHKHYVEAFEARQRVRRELEAQIADKEELETELAKLPDEKVMLLRGAKAYKREGQKDKLEKMVESLPLEERVTFFVEHKEYESAALVYVADGKKADAAKLLYERGNAKEAYRYAVDTDDDLLVTRCATALAEIAYANWLQKESPSTASAAKEAALLAIGKAEAAQANFEASYGRYLLARVAKDAAALQQAFVGMRQIGSDVGLVFVLQCFINDEEELFQGDTADELRVRWTREVLETLPDLCELVVSFHKHCTMPNRAFVLRTYRFLGLTEKSATGDLELRPSGHPLVRHLLRDENRKDNVATITHLEARSCIRRFAFNLVTEAFPLLYKRLLDDFFAKAICPSSCIGEECSRELKFEDSDCAYRRHCRSGYDSAEQFKEMALAAGYLLRFGRYMRVHRQARASRLTGGALEPTRNYLEKLEDRIRYNDFVILYVDNVYPKRPKFEMRQPAILPVIQAFHSDIRYFCNHNCPTGGYGARLVRLNESVAKQPRTNLSTSAPDVLRDVDADKLPESLRDLLPTDEFCGICGLRLRQDEDPGFDDQPSANNFGFQLTMPSLSEHRCQQSHQRRADLFLQFAKLLQRFSERQNYWRQKLDALEEQLSAQKSPEVLEVIQSRRAQLERILVKVEKDLEADASSLSWDRFRDLRPRVDGLEGQFKRDIVQHLRASLPNFHVDAWLTATMTTETPLNEEAAGKAAAVEGGAADAKEDDDMALIDEDEAELENSKPYHDVKEFRTQRHRGGRRRRRQNNNNNSNNNNNNNNFGGGRYMPRNLPPRMQNRADRH